MMKKAVLLFLSVIMLVSCLVGCTVPESTTEADTTETPAATDAPKSDLSFRLTGNAVYENGVLSAKRGKTSYAFFSDPVDGDISVSCNMKLNSTGLAGILFCAKDENNCIMLSVDYSGQALVLQRVTDGIQEQLGRRPCLIQRGSEVPIRLEICDGIFRLYYNENPLDTDPYPKFESYVTAPAGHLIGFRLGNGIADYSDITVSTPEKTEGKTYTNPVVQGADPDVLYYNGVYYLYQRIADGSNIFRVSTSTDLVNWKKGNIIYTHDKTSGRSAYMSPNVAHINGKFYLTFAAKIASGKHRIFIAVCDTPDGVFKHTDAQLMLHDDVSEIGGHIFMDGEDIYITFARFNDGNHLYIEKINVTPDHRFVPVEGTLTLISSPTESYEIDEYGKISEGGIIIKHEGYYYMFLATGHYKGHYGGGYSVATNPLGPYTKYEYNDILTHTSYMDGCGDMAYAYSPDGSELFFVYHCHAAVGTVEPRMTCIDRIKFVPNPDGGPDILSVYGPTVTPQPIPSGSK